MLFYFPLALIIALSVIYRNDFGLKTIAIYWILWVVGFLVLGWLELPGYFFVAFQALLAVSMLIHQKIKGI